jgi:hypothetical protein
VVPRSRLDDAEKRKFVDPTETGSPDRSQSLYRPCTCNVMNSISMRVALECAVINTWTVSIGRPQEKRNVEGDAVNEEIILKWT